MCLGKSKAKIESRIGSRREFKQPHFRLPATAAAAAAAAAQLGKIAGSKLLKAPACSTIQVASVVATFVKNTIC
jgi:hypothetical protein